MAASIAPFCLAGDPMRHASIQLDHLLNRSVRLLHLWCTEWLQVQLPPEKKQSYSKTNAVLTLLCTFLCVSGSSYSSGQLHWLLEYHSNMWVLHGSSNTLEAAVDQLHRMQRWLVWVPQICHFLNLSSSLYKMYQTSWEVHLFSVSISAKINKTRSPQIPFRQYFWSGRF